MTTTKKKPDEKAAPTSASLTTPVPGTTFKRAFSDLGDVIAKAEQIREALRATPSEPEESKREPTLEERVIERKYVFTVAQARLREALEGSVPCYADDRKTFENYSPVCSEAERVVKICKRFAERLVERVLTEGPEKSSMGIALCGRTGTGKSHVASAMYVMLRAEGSAPVCMRASAFFRLFADKATANRISAALSKVSCLILDELGRTAISAYEANHLLEVLDMRQRLGLPTVIVSNLPVHELRGALGDAIASRFDELFFTLACTWADHRRRNLRELDPLQVF